MARNPPEQLGLPQGFKAFSPGSFEGLNQEDSPIGIDDSEFQWLENLIRVGKSELRAVWDRGAPIYQLPDNSPLTIVSHFFFNIGQTDYAAIYFSDGTAIQVNTATLIQKVISAIPGTFYNGATLPADVQWGSLYLLIANNFSRNDYWIWDGNILYQAGSIGPEITVVNGGSGYSTAPTITISGGLGSGVVLTPTLSGGSIISLGIVNPGSGYQPGDEVQIYFSGGGADDDAQLTAVLGAQVVTGINVTNGGAGYSAAPAVTISGGGGSGATAVAVVSSGGVTSIIITNPGTGYTSTPIVTFGGPGTGASAVALIAGGGVASVTVVDGGTGFTGTPLLTFVGGGGSGATAVAVMSGSSIASVTMTNSGLGYSRPPAVVVESGLNTAARATLTLMPYGVSGSSLETYQSRVWIPFPNQSGSQNNGGVFLVSAPGSLTDFATSDGGLLFVSNDRFLRKQYTNIRQSNGYLYPFGDSSVDVISNVQTGGNPLNTVFNYQNTDPQVGTSWRDTLQDYGRTILFANELGVWGLYGGSVVKISAKLNDIFVNAVFPPARGALTPTSAVASLYKIKCYFLLLTIEDPFTGQNRNVILAWDEQRWFVVSQSTELTYISTQEINSNLTAWGTDGKSLFPLCNMASTALEKRLTTKLYGASSGFIQKGSYALWLQATDRSGAGLTMDVTMESNIGSFPLPTGPLTILAPFPKAPVLAVRSSDVYAENLGVTVSWTAADFSLYSLVIGYWDETATGNLNEQFVPEGGIDGEA